MATTTVELRPLTEIAGVPVQVSPRPGRHQIPMEDIEALIRSAREPGPDELPQWGPIVDPDIAVPIISRARRNPQTGRPYGEYYDGYDPSAPEHVLGELRHYLYRLWWALHEVGVWMPSRQAMRARDLLATLTEEERATMLHVIFTMSGDPMLISAEELLTRLGNDDDHYAPTRIGWEPHPEFDSNDWADNTAEPVVEIDYTDIVDWIARQVGAA